MPAIIGVEDTMGLLGMRAKDRITGFEGVITSVSFDLYGCVQAVLAPGLTEDGKIGESHWFDTNRLEVTSDAPVMDAPDFFGTTKTDRVAAGMSGAAEKPLPR